jgi:hypothetical protein
MHYYKGPLPTPNTREHWLFYRPYGKCVYPDGRVVLFNRGYQAIFERRPGQAPTTIAGCDSAESRDGERDIFFYHDGTDPREANRRIDAELTALGLPPLPPMPRLSIDEALGRMRDRLLGELQQRFPETSFYIDGSGRWTGSNYARVMWTDGPTKTTISTVVQEHHEGGPGAATVVQEHHGGVSIIFARLPLNYH